MEKDMEKKANLEKNLRLGRDDEDDFTPTHGKMKKNHPRANFMHAYHLSGEAKVQGAIEFLDTLIEAGVKFLLFAHHINVLDMY